MSKYIYYKIVDNYYKERDFFCKIQCINTHAVFDIKMIDIVFDADILEGLHPIQSCYIGIEYAQHESNNIEGAYKHSNNMMACMVNRYGKYKIHMMNRGGKITVLENENKIEYLMDPRDIVLTKDLIKEFDSTQAFYIGMWAGAKIKSSLSIKSHITYPALRLVR